MSSANTAAYVEAPQASPLVVRKAPQPASPSPTQLVIRAHSIAINQLDVIIQQTDMIVPEDAYPCILGSDIAEEVVAVGSSVHKVKPGDRVLACVESGCFQLLNTVEQSLVVILPNKVTYLQGSVLPLALCITAVMLF
jgi:NADPH:quinone reductase-like Zn-dependent oxidoreductase